MESLVVTSVDGTWQSVSLSATYTSPIPVCSVVYVGVPTPAVVRIHNVGTNSFDLRVQNPGDGPVSTYTVNCIVVEEGAWQMPDGTMIEAHSYSSSVMDYKNSWNGEAQSYTNSYTNPVVLGQVMTFNDPDWSVFWCRGSSRQAPPSSTDIHTGIMVAEDTDRTRASETIGFIVVEAGHGGTAPSDFEAKLGADSVRGIDNNANGYSYSYSTAFASEPVVKIVTQAAMDGNDGGWAVLTDSQSASSLGLLIDEDQISNSERKHTTEQVAYMVFGEAGTIPLLHPDNV